MIEFKIKDMIGEDCAKTITRVIKETVPAASIQRDLQNHVVRVDGISDVDEIERVIREVGYTPGPHH